MKKLSLIDWPYERYNDAIRLESVRELAEWFWVKGAGASLEELTPDGLGDFFEQAWQEWLADE